MAQQCGTYLGYAVVFEHISYSCPALRLYGYSTERAIQSAIRRALKSKK